MLDLDPDEDLQLVVETARKFADDVLAPRIRDAEAQRTVDHETHSLYAEIGLAGLELPEALGGAELGALARVLVNEELAAGDPGAALALDPVGPALYPLLELGGAAAVERFSQPLENAKAPARTCLVFAEDAPLAIEGDRLRGTVPWVPADRVERLVWLARDRAVVVEDGIRCNPLRGAGLRAAGSAELTIDGPIASQWQDAAAAARARARARLACASLMLGVMRFTCDFSRAYALEREAFGRKIAHHQALAFLITDMRMAVDGARLLVHEAAWRIDAGHACVSEASSAYAQCIEASRLIGPNGVQILGGHGFMADYPMEKSMREARALGLLFGGFDLAIEEAGRALCEAGAPVALGLEHDAVTSAMEALS